MFIPAGCGERTVRVQMYGQKHGASKGPSVPERGLDAEEERGGQWEEIYRPQIAGGSGFRNSGKAGRSDSRLIKGAEEFQAAQPYIASGVLPENLGCDRRRFGGYHAGASGRRGGHGQADDLIWAQ